MGTLNSRHREALRDHLLYGTPLPASLFANYEVDVDALVLFVENLRRYLPHLRGYQPLESWYERTDYAPHTWPDGLRGHHPQCIQVLDAQIQNSAGDTWHTLDAAEQERYPKQEGRRLGRMDVYLTRKGRWIVWVNLPTPAFHVTSDTAEAMQLIAQLVPSECSLLGPGGTSPALYALRQLRNFVSASDTRVEEDQQLVKAVLTAASATSDRYQLS